MPKKPEPTSPAPVTPVVPQPPKAAPPTHFDESILNKPAAVPKTVEQLAHESAEFNARVKEVFDEFTVAGKPCDEGALREAVRRMRV